MVFLPLDRCESAGARNRLPKPNGILLRSIYPIVFLWYNILLRKGRGGTAVIDLHCHILPHVDDGSPSMEESLQMAAMAAESGVVSLAATPHFQYSEEEADVVLPALERAVARFRTELSKHSIPLNIYSGAEILCAPDTPMLLHKGKLPTIAGSDYLLVEFWFDTAFTEMDDMLDRLAAEGVTPIVAHPERYFALQREPSLIRRWFDGGYVLQINKGSVLGSLGRESRRTADWILRRGFAHLVASDAHTSRVRTTDMRKIREKLEELCGQEYTNILLQLNPGRIVGNQPVLPPDEQL